MNMLSVDKAISEIVMLKDQEFSAADKLAKFNKVISRIEPGKHVTDRKFTFWSGGFSPSYQSSNSDRKNISSNSASSVLAKQSDEIGVIKDTNYAKVLDNSDVQNSYLEIKNVDLGDKKAVLDAGKEYGSGLNGPWAQASQSVAENVRGDVLAFTPYETGKSTTIENGKHLTESNNIYTEREFPTLLNNSKVTSINGISTDNLRKIRDNPEMGIDAARHEANLASREYIKGLHSQPSLSGDKLCFNKEFLDKQSLKQVENFQSKLDNPRIGKSVSKNTPDVTKKQQASLDKMYKDGNPLNAGKASQINQTKNTDLKQTIESRGIKTLHSRTGKYEGKIIETNRTQVAQQVGKHVYVHNINSKEHDIKKDEFVKIRASKGAVKSIEKVSLDKQKGKASDLKKNGPSKEIYR